MMAGLILLIFILGYVLITIEHTIKIDKAAIALLTGVGCWTSYVLLDSNLEEALHHLTEHLFGISGILFFLLGAMVIVGLMDAHDAFAVITDRVSTRNPRKLLTIVTILTFFLSAFLDNLTASIVMISMVRKWIPEQKMRFWFAGVIIVAANAGGVWSPIGDVTTTMLWIGGQLPDVMAFVKNLFLPALLSVSIPFLWVYFKLPTKPIEGILSSQMPSIPNFERNLIFVTGLGCLLFVPVFKTITHLPPFMGMMGGLGLMWMLTELIHRKKDNERARLHKVHHILTQIDTPSILFFLGILLAVSAMESSGILGVLAKELAFLMNDSSVGINASVGILSAIVDNVPIVAAVQGMYPVGLGEFAPNGVFWELLAFCAGTGGSILIIGSAAGVAVMGMEKISFLEYLKKHSLPALLGYFAGIILFTILHL